MARKIDDLMKSEFFQDGLRASMGGKERMRTMGHFVPENDNKLWYQGYDTGQRLKDRTVNLIAFVEDVEEVCGLVEPKKEQVDRLYDVAHSLKQILPS